MFGVVVLLALGAFLFRFCMRRRRDRLSGHAQVANVHLDRRHRQEMSKVKAHDERSNSLQPSSGLMQSSNPGIESNAVTDLGEEDDPAIAQHHSDRIISTADLQRTMAENSAGVYIGPGKQQTKNSTQSVPTNDGPFMDRSDSPAFNVTGTREEIDSKPAKCSSRLLPSPDQSEDLNINDVAENPQNHPTPLLSRSLSSVDSVLPRRHRFMKESSASRPSNLLDENPPSNGLFSGGNQIANGPPVKFTDTGNERIEAGRHPTELGDSGWEARDSELVAFYQSEFVLKDKDAESRCDSESGLSNAESERTKAQRMSKARSHQSLPDVNSEYYPKQNRSDTLRQSELLYTGSPFFSSRHRPRTPSDFYSSDDSRRNTQLNIRDSIIAKRKPTVASRSCPELNNTSDITEQTHGFRPLGSSSGMSNSIATQVDAPQGGGTFLSSSYSRGPLPLDRSNYFSEPSETLGELTRSSSEIFHLVSRWDVSIRQMDRSFLRSTSRLRVSNLAPLETNADTSALLSGTAYQHTSTTQQGATTSPSSAWEF
ncbi:hypothetical protein FRC02_004236 [Tulasnella sp. 418]|nr:hypothetical protein FRC02_004236 [Tulasnella sp. 418]